MSLELPWDGHAMLIWGLILVMLCKAIVYCAIGWIQCTSQLETHCCCNKEEWETEEIYLEVIARPPQEEQDPSPMPEDPFPDEEDGYERMTPN